MFTKLTITPQEANYIYRRFGVDVMNTEIEVEIPLPIHERREVALKELSECNKAIMDFYYTSLEENRKTSNADPSNKFHREKNETHNRLRNEKRKNRDPRDREQLKADRDAKFFNQLTPEDLLKREQRMAKKLKCEICGAPGTTFCDEHFEEGWG